MNVGWIILVLLCIWAVVGAASILHQFIKGFQNTNLNDNYVWGSYIQGCFFFSSVAAGTLILVAAMTLLSVAGVSLLMEAGVSIAFSLLLASQALLGLDLGKPTRAALMLGTRNFHSPLTWDFYTMGISTVLSFIYILGILPSNPVVSGIWSILLLVSGFLCLAAHTMFFLPGVKGGYQTNAFLGLEIFLYSLLGGNSVLILSGLAFSLKIKMLTELQMITGVLLLTVFAAHKIALLKQERHKRRSVKPVLNIAVILLSGINLLATEVKLWAFAAAATALALVFADKYCMVIDSQKKNMIPEPYGQFQDKVMYRPSFKEWNVLFGCISICALIGYGIVYLRILQ